MASPRGRSARGTTGGSVAHADMKTAIPTVMNAMASTSPASGNHSVPASTATTGPTTKDSSSATWSNDMAVCKLSGWSRYRCAQRARDIGPGCGRTVLRP
jgi:hypothetical protein